MEFSHALFGVILPFLGGFGAAAFSSRGASHPERPRGTWVAAAVLAAGYLCMHVHLLGFLQPNQAANWTAVRTTAWLSWLMPIAALMGIWSAGQRPLLASLQRFVLLLALLFTQIHPYVLNDGWTPAGKLAGLAGYGIALLALWLAGESVARREAPAFGFGLVALCAATGAVVVATSGSLLLGQLLGAGAAAAGGAAILSLVLFLRGERPPFLRSLGPPLVVVLAGPLMGAVLYSRTGWDVALLTVLPVLASPAIARTSLARSQTLRAEAVRLLVLGIPLLAALALAWARFEPDPYGY